MPKIPVVPLNSGNNTLTQTCTSQKKLPLFYMSDFSILGLRVNHLEKAIYTMKSQNQRLHIDRNGVNLVIDSISDLKEVIRRLQREEIQCDLSDIVTDVYQG